MFNGKRHTNNDGRNQIRRGKTFYQVRRIARRLSLKFIIAKPLSKALEQ